VFASISLFCFESCCCVSFAWPVLFACVVVALSVCLPGLLAFFASLFGRFRWVCVFGLLVLSVSYVCWLCSFCLVLSAFLFCCRVCFRFVLLCLLPGLAWFFGQRVSHFDSSWRFLQPLCILFCLSLRIGVLSLEGVEPQAKEACVTATAKLVP
jgi:hypothetical protein